MTLDDALKTTMEAMPDCIAAGYIDMETGLLLGLQGKDSDSKTTLELLAMSIANLFLGQGVRSFEAMLSANVDGPDVQDGFGEIAIYSGGKLYVLLRRQDHPDHVICYICHDGANVGLALAKSGMSLETVVAAI